MTTSNSTINFRDYFIYDESSPSLLINKVTRGSRAKAGEPAGAYDNGNGYYLTGLNSRKYLVHRIIYEIHHGAIPKGLEVDHIDGDKANNHIENLRLATKSQNLWNRPKFSKGNSALPKGICERTPGYFHAQLRVNGKRYSKCSKDLSVLIAWLDIKRSELHGEYAQSA